MRSRQDKASSREGTDEQGGREEHRQVRTAAKEECCLAGRGGASRTPRLAPELDQGEHCQAVGKVQRNNQPDKAVLDVQNADL